MKNLILLLNLVTISIIIQSSDNLIVDDENVIITNEVLKENVDCNNFGESCNYNFNYKRHGKNKVNMLVHRHTL